MGACISGDRHSTLGCIADTVSMGKLTKGGVIRKRAQGPLMGIVVLDFSSDPSLIPLINSTHAFFVTVARCRCCGWPHGWSSIG